jgi:hypothetical protein
MSEKTVAAKPGLKAWRPPVGVRSRPGLARRPTAGWGLIRGGRDGGRGGPPRRGLRGRGPGGAGEARRGPRDPAAFWVAYPKGGRADINRDSLWPILAEDGFRPVSRVASSP